MRSAWGSYLFRRHILPRNLCDRADTGSHSHPPVCAGGNDPLLPGPGCAGTRAELGQSLEQPAPISVLVSYLWMYAPPLAMIPFFLGYLRVASLLQESQQASQGRISRGIREQG